ncbi:MAG: DMT family transporter [Candidatus Bipolaricaulaceae bacterium]
MVAPPPWKSLSFALFLLGPSSFSNPLGKRLSGFSWRELLLFVPCGLVGVTIFYAPYRLAIKRCGAALASVLLYPAPVWVVVWGHSFLKEKLAPAKIFALIFATSGVVLVSGEGRISLNPLGFFFGLLSGFSYALYYLIGKRFLTAYPTSYVFSYALLVGSFGLLPFVRVQEKDLVAWGTLLFLGFFSTYGAYTLYFAGLKRLAASQAALWATLGPVVATVVAHFWWGEAFSALAALGSGLILIAAVLGAKGQ